MADQTERIIIEIDGSGVKGEAQQVERAINAIGDAADKAGKKVTGAEKGMDDLAKSLKTVGAGANLSEKQMQSLQTRIGNTSAARAQSEALKQIASAANLSTRATEALGKRMGIAASEIDRITGASKKASTAVREIGVNSQRSAALMTMMTNAASAFGVALSVAGLVQFGASVIKAGIAMDSLQRSFVAITGSQTAAAQELRFLREEADRLGQSFFDLAPIYKSVSAAARGTALEGDAVRKVFSSITEASSALGMSTSDTEGALLALSQMISKGTVQAEELRGQLGERLPGAFNIMARALGVTTSELGKMLEQGQVLADEALPKLAAEISKMYGKAAETAALESAQAAVNKLSEAWTSLKTNLFDSQAFVYATNFLRETVEEWDRILFSVSKTELASQERLTAMLLKARNEQLANLKGYEGDFITDIFRAGDISDLEEEIADLTKKLGTVRGEIASLAPASKESFAVLQDGMTRAGERAGEYIKDLQTADAELKKLTATALDKLEAQYNALKGRVSDSAALDRWYAAEVAKLNEKAAKKNASELSKQVKDAEKAAKIKAQALKEAAEEAAKAAAQQAQDIEDLEMEMLAQRVKNYEDAANARAKAEKDAADEALKLMQQQEAAAQKVMDRITEGTADVFYDMFQGIENGWETLWDSMKSWALRTLAELAAKAATTQIVVPILMSLTGSGTANAAVNALTGGAGGGGFNLSTLSSLVQPGSMLSKIPGMDFVTGMLGTTLPGTAAALTGAFSGVGTSAGMYATGMGFGSGAVANGALQGMTLGGQSLATAAPAMTSGLTLGSALGMGSLGGLGYSLLGGSLGLPQNQWSGITSSLGGALGAWGASALASAAGGAAAGAAAGSVVPVIGTVIGAIIGGLAGSLIGGEEQSPSVIYQAQQMGWGSVDPTTYQFHTKDGAKSKTGNEISTALAAVAGGAFQQVEAAVAALGEQYVDILKESTVEWGRNAGGSWSSWDFGADHNFEELFAKAQADLTGQILKAAEGAFTAAGKDLATGDEAANALSMLSEKAAGSFRALQDAIAAGVQDGNVEAFVAQIQQFQTAMQTVNAVWDSVSQASAELVTPLTQYEQAQRAINAQYDAWIDQLEALGFAAEKVAKIDADRAEVLANLAAENKKAIDSVLRDSAQTAVPLSEFAAAQQRINDQFDGWIEQLEALTATEDQLAQVEADRAVALANLAAAGAGADRVISGLTKTLEGAIADVQSALKSMASNVRANLNAAYNAERSAIRAALDGVLDGMRLEIDGLNSAMKSATDAASAWRSVSDTLSRTEIIPMTLPQAMAGIDAMITGAFRGQAPDADELSKIVGVLSGIEMRDYATRADYDAARGEAASKIATLAGIAGAQVSAADRQLEALESQRAAIELQMQEAKAQADAQLATLDLTYENALEQLDALEGIEKYSMTMDNALAMVVELTNTYGTTQVSLLNAQLALAGGSLAAQQAAVSELRNIAGLISSLSDRSSKDDDDDIPGFAAGGYHSGGLRIVGERGPELEATGPSRIWSASDTRAMLSGGGGSDAAEIRALREDLRAQSRAMVATQQRMTKLLERWNIDGMPEVRTA